ncbi:MAG: phospho-sugar mutase [Chlamydiae bacterium]|nr:phospho-sugar mutase [Chlamydiota bacterium]
MKDDLDAETKNRIDSWLNGPYDPATKQEIQHLLKSNPKQLTDAFFTHLSFGTGGLRGVMGVGTNRMNIYTVRFASQAIANYLLKQESKQHTIAIAFDSRHNSANFAHEAARVFAANKITAFLFRDLRPLPLLSFAIRFKQCSLGVMITASHNPKEYNGYKVFWSDGGQIVHPHDVDIMKEAEKIHSPDQVKLADLHDVHIQFIDPSIDLEYIKTIHPLQLSPKENREHGNQLAICYTPLHGTGMQLLPKALKDWGFSTVHLVGPQLVPDGNFPTVKSPNPEDPQALKLGIEHLLSTKSDILLATDPDADRIAVAEIHQNKPYSFNGNEIAAICAEYLCQKLKEKKLLSPKKALVTTIVSTDLLREICKAYQIHYFEVLTGFKYIGELITKWEKNHEPFEFLFGAEESYGYLIGTHCRDKDAIVLGCLISEIALFLKIEGKSLFAFLSEIYKKYGMFREKQKMVDLSPGEKGMQDLEVMMKNARSHSSLKEKNVIELEDYQKGIRINISTKKEEKLTLPKSNVLRFRFKDSSKLIIRPSGTEPKLKIYAGVKLEKFSSMQEGTKECEKKLEEIFLIAEDLLQE